jgi:hypothetical protein
MNKLFSILTATLLLAASLPSLAQGIDVAASANGGVASASSTYNAGTPVSSVIDGDRKGVPWGSGGGWNDATYNVFPDWVQVNFAQARAIDEIDVFTLQDNYSSPVDPTPTMTFNYYGITAFDVQYWDGANWITVPGGSVTGNNLVWRSFSVPSITTDRIRVLINGASGGYSRITEIEAYSNDGKNLLPTVSLNSPVAGTTYTAPANITFDASAVDRDGSVTKVDFYNGTTLLGTLTNAPYTFVWSNVSVGNYSVTAVATDNLGGTTTSDPINVTVGALTAPRTNLASAANGGVATASSTYSVGTPASSVINGDRKGTPWGSGGGWNDATVNAYPDWVQVNFTQRRMIDEIDVFTLQDSYSSPADPTPTMTFTTYGITAFDIQYWDGVSWITIPGGSVTGNKYVWRSFSFPPVTTDRIRVLVNGANGGYSRITEIEAYTPPGGGNLPPTVALTSPTEGQQPPTSE